MATGPGWQQGIVLHTDDIESVIAALRHAGVEVSDAERQGWGVQAQFADPDGNGRLRAAPAGWSSSWLMRRRVPLCWAAVT